MIARELAARWIVVAGFGPGALAAVLVAALDGPHETGIAALTPLRPATAAAASPSAGESDTQIRGIEPLQPCL